MAAASELRVLSALGGELERELPFGIVRQLLEPVVAGCAEKERQVLFAALQAAGEVRKPGEVDLDPPAGRQLGDRRWEGPVPHHISKTVLPNLFRVGQE
jgi:hypothetical protein